MRTSLASIVLSVILLGAGLVSPVYGQEGFPSHRIGLIPTDELSSDVKQAASAAVREKSGKKSGPMAQVGLELTVLFYHYRAEGRSGVQSLLERREKIRKEKSGNSISGTVHLPITEDGRYVQVDAVATDDPPRLFENLRRLGLKNGAQAENVVSGYFPISALDEAAQLSALRGMALSYTRVRVGEVGSEADTSHAAFEVRQDFGLDGSGQKVCGLSDSYNTSGTAASGDVASGDLPGEDNPNGYTTSVDVLEESESGGTDEGRAMLQLIHDIAPGAALGFHTATGGRANFASGIRELANAECNVIVDDIGYANQPLYQDGIVTNAVDDVVNNGEAVYFSSAGNNGSDSYESSFRNSGEEGVISSSSDRHDFDPSDTSVDTEQQITVDPGGTFQVFTFQWTDPTAAVSGSSGPDTDLDIALVDQGGTLLSSGADDNIGMGIPVETIIAYSNDTESRQTINLVIEKADGPDPDRIKYIYRGSGFTIDEYDTRGPTVFGHPMAENAVAVGAAAFVNTAAYNENTDPAVMNDFSSKGGIPIRFDQNGNAIDPIVRQKPNVTGVDGVSNTFFGNDATGDGTPNFFGTSAAAPNVAAIAALMVESGSFLPSELYDRLESTAADITRRLTREEGLRLADSSDGEPTGPNGGTGVDDWSGHGFVRATEAVPPPANVRITFPEDPVASVSSGNDGTVELNWEIRGAAVASVDALVVEQQFFDGEFAERDRITEVTGSTFDSTVEDLRVGTHTFRISAVSENGTVLQNTSVKVRLQAQQPEVSVYPNPFDEQVNIAFVLRTQQDLKIEVFDVLGRRVATRRRSGYPGDDARPVQFDASELGPRSSGVYFIRVNGEDFEETVRAVRVQ